MRDLSLHILDLVDNSLRAQATRIEVRICEDLPVDKMYVDIIDDGIGMRPDAVAQALDPFFTTKSGKAVGMGLALFGQAAREGGGSLRIQSEPGKGTSLRAVFGLSHPDRKPMGDIEGTLQMLRESHPEVELIYHHSIINQEVGHEAQTGRS